MPNFAGLCFYVKFFEMIHHRKQFMSQRNKEKNKEFANILVPRYFEINSSISLISWLRS